MSCCSRPAWRNTIERIPSHGLASSVLQSLARPTVVEQKKEQEGQTENVHDRRKRRRRKSNTLRFVWILHERRKVDISLQIVTLSL
jgi:hypothetical protein